MRKTRKLLGLSTIALLFAFTASCDTASSPSAASGRSAAVHQEVQPVAVASLSRQPLVRFRNSTTKPRHRKILPFGRRARCPMSGVEKPVETDCPTSQQPTEPSADQSSEAEEKPAENPMAGCGICHIDVEDELYPTVHFKNKIGCIKCHGKSKAHLADENNEVPPDRLFNRKTIDKFCQKCHECGREQEAVKPKVKIICTDCHGAHTLKPPEKDDEE